MLADLGLTVEERDIIARVAHVDTARGLLSSSARLLRQGQVSPAALRAAGQVVSPSFRPLDDFSCLHYIETPFSELNAVLGGGLVVGRVTEVVGASCSGKTLFCHALAAGVARQGITQRRRMRVLYVDATSSSFSPSALVLGLDDTESRTVLRDVHTARVLDADSFIDLLQQLSNGSYGAEDEKDLSLIIIDGIAALFSPIIGGGPGSIGSAVLGKAGRLLRNLARQKEIAIVTTNWMVSDGAHPALGEQWRWAVHLRLLIEQKQVNPDEPPLFTMSIWSKKPPKNVVLLNLLNR